MGIGGGVPSVVSDSKVVLDILARFGGGGGGFLFMAPVIRDILPLEAAIANGLTSVFENDE